MRDKYPRRFLIYTEYIIDRIEGGYSNHPKDPGKATNFGITEAVARAHGFTGDMRNLTREEAIDIYFQSYWDKKVMDHINNALGLHVYDTAINSGYSRAVKILQEALGVPADGSIGVATMNALSAKTPSELIPKYCICRMHFLAGLSTYSVFGKGWRNRLMTLCSIDWRKYS